MRPRGRPRGQGKQAVWPNALATARAARDHNAIDFDRVEGLVGALLERDWPGAHTLPADATHGEAIASYVAGLAASDKDLLLHEYLILEVMLDEVDGPGVANAVDTFLPPLAHPPSV